MWEFLSYIASAAKEHPMYPKNNHPIAMQLNQENSYWDPGLVRIHKQAYSGVRKELERKYGKYQQHPRTPLRNFCLLLIPIVAEIALIILYPQTLDVVSQWSDDGDSIFILVLPFFPLFWYVYKVYTLQRDLIKLMIAKEHSWLYNPSENPSHWSKLSIVYPELFQKGNENQNMQDEFWGVFSAEKQNVNFYSGIFEYKIVHRTGKGRSSSTYRNTVFAFQLNKTLTTDFRLEPEGMFMKFLNFFRSKEIHTESEEFNKAFSVFYRGQKVDRELDIVKTLSPAVQTRLIELKNRSGAFTLMFRNDTVLVVFHSNLFKRMRTNFFKRIQLDPRDKEKISGIMNEILDLCTQIVPYLD